MHRNVQVDGYRFVRLNGPVDDIMTGHAVAFEGFTGETLNGIVESVDSWDVLVTANDGVAYRITPCF